MARVQTANAPSGFRVKLDERRGELSILEIDSWIASEIKAISPVVERLMQLIEGSQCVRGEEPAVELALREAVNNAVVHGNRMDSRKLVHVRCRCELGKGVSLIVSQQGPGFDPSRVPNPRAVENLEANHGRGIHFMKSVMDKVSFKRWGREVRLCKGPAHSPRTPLESNSSSR